MIINSYIQHKTYIFNYHLPKNPKTNCLQMASFKLNFFHLLDCINPTKYHFRPSRLSHKLITSLVQTIEHNTAGLSDSLQQWWTMCEGEGRCEEVFSWPLRLKGGSWVWLLVSTLSLCYAASCGKLIKLLNATLCHFPLQQGGMFP